YGRTSIYLGSDQYSICNNFTLAKGRDISPLDIKNYNQVVVLGARTAEYLFGVSDPLGKTVTISGNPFNVVGVYASKDRDPDSSIDNMAVIPYSRNHKLNNGSSFNSSTANAVSSYTANEAVTMITGFLSELIPSCTGDSWVQSQNQ